MSKTCNFEIALELACEWIGEMADMNGDCLICPMNGDCKLGAGERECTMALENYFKEKANG